MQLFSVICFIVLASTALGNMCPDDRPCDGECCKRFIFGQMYWCCKPPYVCRREIIGSSCFLNTISSNDAPADALAPSIFSGSNDFDQRSNSPSVNVLEVLMTENEMRKMGRNRM